VFISKVLFLQKKNYFSKKLFALFFFSADWFVNPTSRSPTFDFWILDKKYLLDFFSTFPVKGSRPKQKEDRANTNEIWKIGNFIFATFFFIKIDKFMWLV
jgi:hypothetical protein